MSDAVKAPARRNNCVVVVVGENRVVVLVLEVQWFRADTRAYAFGMDPSTDSRGERKENVNDEHGGSGRKEKGMERK